MSNSYVTNYQNVVGKLWKLQGSLQLFHGSPISGRNSGMPPLLFADLAFQLGIQSSPVDFAFPLGCSTCEDWMGWRRCEIHPNKQGFERCFIYIYIHILVYHSLSHYWLCRISPIRSIQWELTYVTSLSQSIQETGVGKCPNWTWPKYWGYNLQQMLKSDVKQILKMGHLPNPDKPSRFFKNHLKLMVSVLVKKIINHLIWGFFWAILLFGSFWDELEWDILKFLSEKTGGKMI